MAPQKNGIYEFLRLPLHPGKGGSSYVLDIASPLWGIKEASEENTSYLVNTIY
jgi:hypothetical protein